jgi:hypothetical protein
MSKQMLIGAAIGAGSVAAIWIISDLIFRGDEVRSWTAGLAVDYEVQGDPTEGTIEAGTITQVRSIKFFPHYIVVKNRRGDGRVFLNERTLNLKYRPGKYVLGVSQF